MPKINTKINTTFNSFSLLSLFLTKYYTFLAKHGEMIIIEISGTERPFPSGLGFNIEQFVSVKKTINSQENNIKNQKRMDWF